MAEEVVNMIQVQRAYE
ncbi:flagellar basal body rod C-terminal domain-containing protein [Shigella flexneri]